MPQKFFVSIMGTFPNAIGNTDVESVDSSSERYM